MQIERQERIKNFYLDGYFWYLGLGCPEKKASELIYKELFGN